MIHSSRQTRPTSTLRRTASATPSFNTDATDFSKQFAFHHLLNSPLPSPALPSIVPRHGKRPTPRPFRTAFRRSARLSAWLCGLALLYWLVRTLRDTTTSPSSVTYVSLNVNEYSIAGRDPSTHDAAPMVVADLHKKPRWTVSIPQGASFPLKPSQYAEICAQSDHIVKQLSTGHSQFHSSSRDPQATTNFVDVQEAHDQGILSPPSEKEIRIGEGTSNDEGAVSSQREVESGMSGKNGDRGICEKSLIFLMESADAGMGKTVLGLWMAYGLAQEERRAFFIDDSNWAYGNYTTFFNPPPVPSCTLPPASQRLPCPHQTRHLVVSTSTYQWVFGDLVVALPHSHHSHQQAMRKHRAFSLARVGHDALFHLTGTDAAYLSTRLAELDATTYSHGAQTIGLHVRRGDRRPWEPQYSDSYIPPSTYLATAQSLLDNHFNRHNTTLTHEAASGLAASTILLASDDPEIYSTPEFSTPSVQRAQSQILLASKDNLDAALPGPAPTPTADPAFIKFVEPNVGWEGGFFASIFWGLGNPIEGRRAARGERDERPQVEPNEETLRLR
ncbi:MAG: hypothetical protein Q9170_002859, partial [Blastenia crenularia]